MPAYKLSLLRLPVSFKKSNDPVLIGQFDLYDDRVVPKTSHRFSLDHPGEPPSTYFSKR